MAVIAYIGNFRPEHSTENDIRRTLESMGHHVVQLQEDDSRHWQHLLEWLGERPNPYRGPAELVLWTSTYDYAQAVGHEIQREMQWQAANAGVPTMGIHLDRWWGLQRWPRVLIEPFFRCDYVLTADGGHQHEFEAAGVNHLWSPPAIAPHNAILGMHRPEFACDIAFVGSWQGGYHEEWRHRPQLVKHLDRTWGRKVNLRFFPERGRPAVRGDDLADLYASAKVVVGDSCLVPKTDGSPMTHYTSDRVFETVGRGGLLIHPFVPGVVGTADEDLMQGGVHLLGWDLGNWEALDATIEWALSDPQTTAQIRNDGFDHVMANHTYASRLDWALGLVGL